MYPYFFAVIYLLTFYSDGIEEPTDESFGEETMGGDGSSDDVKENAEDGTHMEEENVGDEADAKQEVNTEQDVDEADEQSSEELEQKQEEDETPDEAEKVNDEL